MLDASVTEKFAETIRGQVLTPGADSYESARRIWNGMIDRKPAVIAQCSGTADVISAVKFARDNQLEISIKGGGHGVAGNSVCDGGLMIDLSQLRSVRVNPRARTVQVDPGATLADLDHETQAFGLVVPGGIVSSTGVAGLTLGGGMGHTSRKFGLTVDSLISADVVTARGELLHASEDENEDLFWALRGGGGNFGVVTSFEFKLHELGPEIQTAQVFYPFENAEKVLKAYRDLMANAPDELSCYALAVHVPPAPPFPEADQGKLAIALVACYTGEADEGMKLLSPLAKLGDPIFEYVGPMAFVVLQSGFDAGTPKGARYYWKSCYFDELTDDAISAIVENVNPLPGPLSLVSLDPMGGAISRVSSKATPYPHRDATFSLGIWSGWTDPESDETVIKKTRELYEALAPHGTGAVYANYLDRDEAERVKEAFGGNLQRLQEVKAKYDPDNLFHLNQNVTPGK